MDFSKIMEALRQCVVLSLFISMVRLLLGQSELHKYFQFFAGLVLLLLFFTPLLRFFGKEDLLLQMGFQRIRAEYEQAQDFSKVLKDYGQMADAEATRCLVVGFGEALEKEAYEIYEHEAAYSEGRLKRLTLFIRLKKGDGEVSRKQRMDCTEKIKENFSPDFEIRVMGGKK